MKKKRSAKTIIEDAQEAAAGLQLAKAKAEAAKWQRHWRDASAAASNLKEQLDCLIGIRGEPLIQQFKRPAKGRPCGVAAIVPATDWHVEEKVSLEATNGKNEFDLERAEDRIRRFYTKVLRLIDWQNGLAPVTELWHPLLGDLLSGYIHEELMESNALSPTEACVFLQEMICSGIDLWLKKTKLPIYIPTCVGNHSRTTPKKRIKTSYANNFEWLLYMNLAKYYAKSRRVFWQVGRGYHNIQEIMGRRVRFHHGDGLRYQGGVGGISIPINKAIAQWDKVLTADFDIFGHWHTHLVGYPKWISCGCLMGYSEFSVEIKADFQHPTQAFIVIDRRYGMTCAVPIFLTKVEKSRSASSVAS